MRDPKLFGPGPEVVQLCEPFGGLDLPDKFLNLLGPDADLDRFLAARQVWTGRVKRPGLGQSLHRLGDLTGAGEPPHLLAQHFGLAPVIRFDRGLRGQPSSLIELGLRFAQCLLRKQDNQVALRDGVLLEICGEARR